MRSVIAAIMAILGVVLVLGGTAALWAAALAKTRTGESRTQHPRREWWTTRARPGGRRDACPRPTG